MKRLFVLGMSLLLMSAASAEPTMITDNFDILPSADNGLHIRVMQIEPVKIPVKTKKLLTSRSVKSKRMLSALHKKQLQRVVKSLALNHSAKIKKLANKILNKNIKKSLALNTHKKIAKKIYS